MTGRPPSVQPGMMVQVMVADIVATLARVRAAGGETVLATLIPPLESRSPTCAIRSNKVIGAYMQLGLAAQERAVSAVPEHAHRHTWVRHGSAASRRLENDQRALFVT